MQKVGEPNLESVRWNQPSLEPRIFHKDAVVRTCTCAIGKRLVMSAKQATNTRTVEILPRDVGKEGGRSHILLHYPAR